MTQSNGTKTQLLRLKDALLVIWNLKLTYAIYKNNNIPVMEDQAQKTATEIKATPKKHMSAILLHA